MIESVYRSEGSNNKGSNSQNNKIKTPKNVRQIGKIGDIFKIYVEDYVKTYARQLAESDYSERCIAVLIGEYRYLDGEKDVFIYGAIEAPNTYIDGRIIFLEETWTSIYEIIKKYFSEGEIVGWYFGGASFGKEETEALLQVHLDNFAGKDKVLLTYDILEKEDNFYLYDSGAMVLQPGYYIYYEKNEEMQNYMVDHKRVKHEELAVEDHAIKEIRNKFEEKKPPENTEKGQKTVLRLAYAAGTLMTVVALVVGITVMNNNEKMKGLEEALNAISNNLTAEKNESDKKQEETENIFVIDDDATPVMNQTGDNNIDTENEDNNKSVSVTPGETEEEPKESETDANTDTVSDDTNHTNNKDQAENSEANTSEEKSTTGSSNQKESNSNQTNSENIENKETESANTTDTKDESLEDNKEVAVQPTVKPTEKPNKTEASNESKETSKNETNSQNNTIDTSKLKTYTIKAGDTLAGISMKLYGNYKNMQTIKELNQIVDENKIEAGQKILVP